MLIKDYYTILETVPSASLSEIKKAYRRLALEYHPDKKQNDSYAAARFAEIKEAYEVLTNPRKKDAYLQQRWYNQSIGSKRAQATVTPVSVLKQALELEKYVSRLDIHRMDRHGLYAYIDSLTDTDTIEKLKQFDEPGTKKEIVRLLAKSARLLSSKQFGKLKRKLLQIHEDPDTLTMTRATLSQLQQTEKTEKYKPLVILLIVLFICLAILLLGN
jgi:curved DNA-binding protein CbpA